jgi:subtilisin family serine protease
VLVGGSFGRRIAGRVTAATPAELTAICEDLLAGVYEPPSSEPLAVCQWNMALIDANASAWSNATGAGVTIGILDSGVDPTTPTSPPTWIWPARARSSARARRPPIRWRWPPAAPTTPRSAPGGDYFSATDTVQDAVLGALPNTPSVLWDAFDPLEPDLPGITVVDQGARYGFLNGTSMAAPHAAGVAALIRQVHPEWSQGAVAAALERSATPLACPADWEPIDEDDDRQRCYGSANRNSFFGAGMVNAARASAL